MKKAEELREFIENLPNNEIERLVEEFMEVSKKYLKYSKDAKSISGFSIEFDEYVGFDFETLKVCHLPKDGKKAKDWNSCRKLFTANIKWPIPDNDIADYIKSLGVEIEARPFKKDNKAYRFAEALKKEGFTIYFCFKKDILRAWNLVRIEVYF